jgi:hypothetical protein
VSSWSGNQLAFGVAVGLQPTGGTETYGVVSGSARTEVDRDARLVDLEDFSALQLRFPTLADNGAAYAAPIRQALTSAMATISLNRLETSLNAAQTFKTAPVAVNNTPPAIIVSFGPAILVPIDGTPVIKPIANTRFERVVNTQAMLARTRLGATWYLHVYDGWLSAPAFGGPWTRALTPPFGLDDAADNLAAQKLVDLLRASNATPPPSLANGMPAIYVAQTPTELIIFKGQPNFVPVTGTSLLWASNTAADVFIDTVNNGYYILISGRWYRAPGLSGPWTFVAANALPPDFAKIPKDSPAGVVLASVAGTPQAQEALIANSIPQSATISLANPPAFTPSFDGPPQYAQIQGTSLQYIANSSSPIIVVGPNRRDPGVRLRRLHARLPRHGRVARRRGRVRHRLQLHAVGRIGVVSAARDLRRRRRAGLQPGGRLHVRLRHRARDRGDGGAVLGRRLLRTGLLRLSLLRLGERERLSQLG